MADDADDKLASWKQIADFLKVDTRTAQRWEMELRLPVHRPADSKGYSVFAYRAELSSWLRSRAGQKTGDHSEGVSGKGNGGHAADLLSASPGDAPHTRFLHIGSDHVEAANGSVAPNRRRVEVISGSPEEPPAGTAAERVGTQLLSRWPRWELPRSFLGGLALGIALTLASVWLWRQIDLWLSLPRITAVSPISADQDQEIIIEGRGFGYYYTPLSGLDTPFLSIGDETGHWAAGRTAPENADDVTLNVRTWAETQIVVEGFAGAYGQKWYTLKPGDKVTIRVWSVRTGAGPAQYAVTVGQSRIPAANK